MISSKVPQNPAYASFSAFVSSCGALSFTFSAPVSSFVLTSSLGSTFGSSDLTDTSIPIFFLIFSSILADLPFLSFR